MATEKRLIDANALLERLNDSSESWAKNLQAIRNWWPHAVGIKDNISRLIREAPTVDAVEVVRCKDCKHYWKNVNTPGYSGKCTTVNDDDFCSHGERKDNG